MFLGYACAAGQALLDVQLYLPRSWVADRGRCAAAGIPADIEFATKPQLALQMIAAALRAGIIIITTTTTAPRHRRRPTSVRTSAQTAQRRDSARAWIRSGAVVTVRRYVDMGFLPPIGAP